MCMHCDNNKALHRLYVKLTLCICITSIDFIAQGKAISLDDKNKGVEIAYVIKEKLRIIGDMSCSMHNYKLLHCNTDSLS